ncbi:beach-domain-containing protein [Mycena metata]|uniref:Beach-domain-containing protein n=1 Tax=Mycena metata TaxID=1033252 RepID=A0AAD7HHV1_9AGAR|nr:beach-domain-containing protein [Mycena metata]
MLRTLLTPLRLRFDSSPRSAVTANHVTTPSIPDEEELDPEDFARDVLIELMRLAVDKLKVAPTTHDRMEVLVEIQRIMMQDAPGATKDVFREMDGFVGLMGALSTAHERGTGEEESVSEAIECSRLAFLITSDAITDHPENAAYFKKRVGYNSLANAIQTLVADPNTVDYAMGLLLSFAFRNFSLSGAFKSLRSAPSADVETTAREIVSRLGTIKRPGAMALLCRLADQYLIRDDTAMRYAVLKLYELLSATTHRNHVVFSSFALAESLLRRFIATAPDALERSVLQKLLRRLLDMGATPAVARLLFQAVVRADQTLDAELLEVIRYAMKSRWLEHFSMESPASMALTEEGVKGLPVPGFTFMIWVWIKELPATTHPIFCARLASGRALATLSLRGDGKLELSTTSSREVGVFRKSSIHKMRWTHITLVHYPTRSANPTIRLYIDGVLNDGLNWNYPKSESTAQAVTYILGDDTKKTRMSWCVASAHLMAFPFGDDLPRFIHHLGPRYSGNFQDPLLVKFLTYEASTSLNMYLSTVVSKSAAASPSPALAAAPALMKVVRDGLGIAENSIIFSVSPLNCPPNEPEAAIVPANGNGANANGTVNGVGGAAKKAPRAFVTKGDVFIVKAACLDTSLWKIGGAAVPLRLLQVANTPHEVSRALGVLVDGLRNSWQNSEDMERLRGYEILANVLRPKAQMVNMTGFETIFEFLGFNFRSPEHSTVVNAVAYRAIALDFELWARTRQEVQRVHLEHFTTLLLASRYKKFNAKQRFAKFGVVRKLLFALQTNWYQPEVVPFVVDALKSAAQSSFSKEEAIKPIVSYLAANLHGGMLDDVENASSPQSMLSRIDYESPRDKAEQVLEMLISLLAVPTLYNKFTAVLPLTRICILLLGDRPSPVIANQILVLIAISIQMSPAFTRKFELISGWSVLKTVLPSCWDPSVNEAALDVLLGRIGEGSKSPALNGSGAGGITIACPNIVPTIFCALQAGLTSIARNCEIIDDAPNSSWAVESTMEVLIEELMDLHASSNGFREVFKSQQTTQLFVNSYKTFVLKVSGAEQVNQRAIRILEKLTHFGLGLALDNNVAGAQKREILDILQEAESVLAPSAEKTTIDPELVVDSRTIRQRIASARFSIQVGERTVVKTMTRMNEWRLTIQSSERKRLRKNILDLRENRRQVSRLTEWSHLLTSERGLWPNPEVRTWRLDETEGPYRVRKKLEPMNDKSLAIRIDTGDQSIRNVEAPEADSQSIMQVEVPPWAESYEISATDMDDRQLAEEITDDKHRRVRHELEPGDVIEAVTTVARIAGVDSSPGLIIIGRTHLYMLDGLVENDDGEIIDAHEAPRRLFFVPGSIVELDGPQKAQRWSHDQVSTFSDKTFLFRDVALEIYFKDSRSLLVVFLDKERRTDIDQRLFRIIGRHNPPDAISATPGRMRTPRYGTRKVFQQKSDELATAQQRWQTREISNFTYLSILNQISGRTPSDATQYPIFPWVLKDYSSTTLDLTNPDSYRDLTKPMGALTETRREAAEMRYSNLESVGEDPFHYGTHFSSSMIVCHFLIRMSPFTNMFKTLQGGDWDLPDRLFSDIPRAYESAAADVRGDVRELIPEFFTCPEFLENSSNLDFGVQQNSGERIHHVKLPPWAKQDPLLFIIMNRKALESAYVSENLPAWIDLIWGCKQRDPASLNAFHPLSYEGSIDLDTITDELEREATVGIIHNFGQTPRKLFTTPHPPQYDSGVLTLPIGTPNGIEEDPHLLVQAGRCFNDLGPNTPVRELVMDLIGEKMIPCPEGVLVVPYRPHERLEWGTTRAAAGQLRYVIDQKVVQVIEEAFCVCAAFADSGNLVTGCSDYTVRLWKITRGSGSHAVQLGLSHIMRIHTDDVISVTASRPWSVVLSGSKDGSAALWDLNRGIYIRSIWHSDAGAADELSAVHLVAVNDSTGYIATCSRAKLCLHTINGRPMAVLDLSVPSLTEGIPPLMTSLAFHEREFSHLGVIATGGSDGSITLRTWTTDGTPEGEKAVWEFLTIRTMKVRSVGQGLDRPPAVSALKFCGEDLYHGEETGKSFLWTLPE